MEYNPGQSSRGCNPQSELFDLLDRLQGSRLNDQRCELPPIHVKKNQTSPSLSSDSLSRQTASKQMLQRILKHPPPYPMVALINQASHWIEPSEDVKIKASDKLEVDSDCAKMYREHCSGFEHFNFCASDENGQPLVLTIKLEAIDGLGNDENNNLEDDPEYSDKMNVRLILRSIDKTLHQVMRLSDLMPNQASSRPASSVIEAVMLHLSMPPAMPVMFPGISEAMVNFDEHGLSNTYKFGIIYQKFGQVAEEAIFGNQTHSPAMEEFMQLLGQKVRLSQHTGYRGGLDTRHGQTGTHALYEKYKGNEIMFHVSTLLPYVESDEQQLQRKCHIGNDIVSIVFQEVNTPFSPDMIASHFLHAYIVVQPIDACTSITRYRVSVVAQKDVPLFGPPLPSSAIFDKGLAFKDFLLSKLINGERACYQASKFQTLHQRTRATLLVNLAKDLREHTVEYINANYSASSHFTSNPAAISKSPSPSSSRLFTSVKKALKHVGSTKAELNRHVSAGSLSEAILSASSTAERKTSSSNSTNTEDSVKADSGHGDSDGGSLPSSPHLPSCRKKLLSTSQPHLAVLNDHINHGHHMIDTSSVEADDIIFQASNTRIRRTSHHNLVQLQGPLGLGAAKTSVTVISGSVTTIPVGGSPPGSSSASSTASSVSSNSSSPNNVTRLHQDISRLRVDKLELLRQALSAQHEVRQLRQREAQLETDLALAAAEIRRLKSQLTTKTSAAENQSQQSQNSRSRNTLQMHIPL